MEKQINIPVLRFPEFNGEWQLKKFGSLTKRISDAVNVQDEELYYQIGIRSHGKGLFYKDAVTGKSLGDKRVFWVKENTFVVNIVFAWEQAIAKTTEKELGMIASHRFPMYFPINTQSNLDYLVHFFLTKRGKFLLGLASPGGAGRNKTLGQKEFENLKFHLPSVLEQTKIAYFINTIDNKLSFLNSKKQILNQFKKGIIRKLFSKEIRFKDNNCIEFPKWECKKLGEIGTFQTSSVDKLSVTGEKEVFLFNYMNVYRHENINNDTKKRLMKITARDSQINNNNLKKGDILFTPSSETPDDIGHSVVIFEDLDDCVYSYHLMRFRPNVEIDILYSHYFCNTPQVLNQLSKLSTGSTRFTISVKTFSSVTIDMPCLAEQARIANFLSAIDEKINHCQLQIEKTVLYKKGLVQKMFV